MISASRRDVGHFRLISNKIACFLWARRDSNPRLLLYDSSVLVFYSLLHVFHTFHVSILIAHFRNTEETLLAQK